jgi:hypothetical protein
MPATETPHASIESEAAGVLRPLAGVMRPHVQFYRCTDCGTRWGRDSLDKKASWYRTVMGR